MFDTLLLIFSFTFTFLRALAANLRVHFWAESVNTLQKLSQEKQTDQLALIHTIGQFRASNLPGLLVFGVNPCKHPCRLHTGKQKHVLLAPRRRCQLLMHHATKRMFFVAPTLCHKLSACANTGSKHGSESSDVFQR